MTEEEIQAFVAARIRREDRDIEAYVDSLIAFVSREIYRSLRKAGKLERLDSREALRFFGGLQSELDDAGLLEKIQRLRELFDLQQETAKREFVLTTERKRAPSLSDEGKKAVSLYVPARLREVELEVERGVNYVREGLIDRIISQSDNVEAQEVVIEEALGKVSKSLTNQVKDSVATFGRIIQADQIRKAGIQYILYAGPKDERNRLFCALRARNVYTWDEVKTWDNGQTAPSDISPGGFNCRHQLIPLSDALAQSIMAERGQKTVNFYDLKHVGSGR